MHYRQLPLFDGDEGQKLTDLSPLMHAIEPFGYYLRHEGKSENTIVNFQSDLKLLCENQGADTPLGKMTTEKLEAFLRWLEFGRGVPCSRKSYARRVTTLKVFFNWLHQEKILKANPAKTLLQRSGAAPLQPVLSEREVEAILTFVLSQRVAEKPDSRPELLFRLLLETGIKKSEAMRLTLDDINAASLEKPELRVRYGKRQNVYKERIISLSSDWLEVLETYILEYTPESTLFTCTARNLEYILTDTAKAAEVESRISFEIMRWTCAVRDYRAGMDMEALREKMGLSQISWRETREKIMKLAVQTEKD